MAMNSLNNWNNMDTNNFNELIKPFFWIEHENSVSVCLNVGEYKAEIFQAREDEGFEGNGYDWGALAKVFLEEQKTELIEIIKFDPEADMFCVYSSNPDALKSFKGFFRFYKRDFISLKKHVKTAFCFYRVATFPFIRLQESPDKESPSVPAERERK